MTRESTPTSKLGRTGRQAAAFLLIAAILALGVLAVHSAQAAPGQMLGFDMTPATSGVSASSSGVSTTDTCVEVDQGESFYVDLFGTNLENLTHFELRVDFDPDVLAFDSQAVDFNYLLAKDGGSAQFPVIEQENAGRWFIGAADGRFPDSGSGTLARLRFTALDKGTSTLSIAGHPSVYAPLVESLSGSYLGDNDGDTYWDSTLSSGKVAVGRSCSGATPIVTPPPTDAPATTPGPAAAPTDEGDGGHQGGNGSSDGDGGGSGGSDSAVANVGQDKGDGGSGGNSKNDPRNTNNGSEIDPPAASGDDSGSGDLLLIGLAAAAALLGTTGLGLLVWARRNTQL
jgi:hypothetical protein